MKLILAEIAVFISAIGTLGFRGIANLNKQKIKDKYVLCKAVWLTVNYKLNAHKIGQNPSLYPVVGGWECI